MDVQKKPRSTATRTRRALSVRGLAAASLAAFGAIALVVIAWLMASTSQLQRSISTVITETRDLEVVEDLQRTLLTFQRLSNLWLLTGEAALLEETRDLAQRVPRLVAEIRDDGDSAEQQRLVADLERDLNAYLRQREQLEASGLALTDAVQRTRPGLDAVVSHLEALREVGVAEVEDAVAATQRVSSLTKVVGASALALLLLASLIVAFEVRRYLLSPILDLHDAIERLGAGDTEARVAEGGLRETAELSAGFNELADALMNQRNAQLTFLAGVAHDLRNPLSALKLGMRSLSQPRSEEARERTSAMLDRQVNRLARMVDDLLEAARIEGGHLELRRATMDVRDAVNEVVELYAPTSRDHQIETHIPLQPVLVEGDALRVQQVVSNLLSNAIKFSPDGGRIELTVGWEDDEAVISVADQGRGIERDALREIFRPFRRRKPELAPGAGLGLSVVHRIVTAHGGTIDVESTLGVGSTFHVRIPRSAAVTEASRKRSNSRGAAGEQLGQNPHRG